MSGTRVSPKLLCRGDIFTYQEGAHGTSGDEGSMVLVEKAKVAPARISDKPKQKVKDQR